jgi:hypothetical protein
LEAGFLFFGAPLVSVAADYFGLLFFKSREDALQIFLLRLSTQRTRMSGFEIRPAASTG